MSRDTTTGLKFEEKVSLKMNGIDLTKHNLYKYLKSLGIDYKDIVSKNYYQTNVIWLETICMYMRKNFNVIPVQRMKNHKLVDLKFNNLRKLLKH